MKASNYSSRLMWFTLLLIAGMSFFGSGNITTGDWLP